MNRFICERRNKAEKFSQKRGKQPSTVALNEEVLVHSERFTVDFWIEESFVWILSALFMVSKLSITENFNYEVF